MDASKYPLTPLRPAGGARARRARSAAARRARWLRRFGALLGLAVLAAVAYSAFALLRSLPQTVAATPLRSTTFARGNRHLAWPSQGEAAIGIQGLGLVGSRGSKRPGPIASVTKVMTALLVLRDHPLAAGASGPQILVTPADVARYQADVASGQSVVLVRAGERLTERQALEGLLLPSGNNLATLLAEWDAGSQGAFVAKMNAAARELGLAHTRYTGASGVEASTVSTAEDQLRLAMHALTVPAFAQTVAMTQATLPVAGTVYNKNTLLGRDGIVGIKPGNTLAAGGCFVFAAHEQLGRRAILVIGVVLHQPVPVGTATPLATAFGATLRLLASTHGFLANRTVLRRAVTLGWIKTAWAKPVALITGGSASLIGWPGLSLDSTIRLTPGLHAPLTAGERVGSVIVVAGAQRVAVPLVTSRALPSATPLWRLAHP